MATVKILFEQFSLANFMRLSLFKILRRFLNKEASVSYAQTGEDFIISFLLKHKKKGTYVDVGCHEPIKLLSTFTLYEI